MGKRKGTNHCIVCIDPTAPFPKFIKNPMPVCVRFKMLGTLLGMRWCICGHNETYHPKHSRTETIARQNAAREAGV